MARLGSQQVTWNCQSDAVYLVVPESRSRAGGFHFLGDKNRTQFNGPILVLAKIIKYVNEDDVQHLRQAIEAKYPVKFKMQPTQYIGINLKWNYTTRELIG